jgi:gamma-polyglutamate biosynthesis protein CapC
MLIESIALGLVYGFALFEWTGIVAGGLVAPGYMALYFNDPVSIAVCLATALLTLGIVRILSSYCILYGRRRFIVCVLIAFFLQWTVVGGLMDAEFARGTLDLIGFIIPGLLANEMQRQGIGVTLAALLVLSGLVWITMHLFALI